MASRRRVRDRPTPRRVMTATAGSSAMTLAELAQNAGAGQIILDYLNARGIKTTPTLALISTSREEFLSQVVRPLLEGYQKGTTRLVVEDDEKPIAQAVMEHMWQEAQLQWQQRLAAVPVNPPQIAAATAAPPSSSGTSAASPDKTPKTLPAQIWQKQISRYNGVTLEGRPRKFPEREVLGAEAILGRMWFEHTTTKSYTPTGLGEILQKRSFTASGDVNPLQKQTASKQLLRIEDDCLVQDEEGKSWTPRSILAVIDGVNAVRWAWILLQIGEEDHKKTISTPLRTGRSFGEVSVEVMTDVDMLNECMSRDLSKDTKPALPKKRPAPEDNFNSVSRPRSGNWQPSSNSKGAKGNQKGKPSFAQWNNSQKWKSWRQYPDKEGNGSQDQAQGR
eukprot:s2498_g6.t1